MTPAFVLTRIGQGIGWCAEQVLFTTTGWWIIGGVVVGWCLLFAWAEEQRKASDRRASDWRRKHNLPDY